MSREAFGDPPESQEPPDLCPVCGNDWHAEDCEFGKEVARRLKAERDAHKLAHENEQLRRLSSLDAMRAGKLAEDVERYSALHARLFAEKTAAQIELEMLREALFRLWPAVEKAMAGMVFTADQAGDVAADMSTIRAAIAPERTAPGCKTPDGCRENGCLGWCDEHRPEVATRCEGCAELRDQLREKAAWCDELERDAERYRFVRTADKVGISAEAARDPVAYDDAIDRAMARSKTPNAGDNRTRSGPG